MVKKTILGLVGVGVALYSFWGVKKGDNVPYYSGENPNLTGDVSKKREQLKGLVEKKLNSRVPPKNLPSSFVSFEGDFERFKDFDSEKFFESLSDQEKKDFVDITDIFEKLIMEIPNIDELASSLYVKGYAPSKEKRGHPKTGFRQVLNLQEKNAKDGLIREFYGSYLQDGNKIVFDRLYYGFLDLEGVFEQLVKQVDSKLANAVQHKSIHGKFVRWDVGDGKFVFINADYQLAGENIVLVGHEFEIH